MRSFIYFVVLVVSFSIISCTPAAITKSFDTPEKTFWTWRQSVDRLDLETLMACYASSAQPAIRKDISMTSKEGIEAMQQEAKNTTFEIQKIVFEDNRAYLRVERRRSGTSDIEIVNMVKETEGWKLLP